jgi:WD40 repeat protein
LQGRGLVELTWLEGQTWRDLQRAMRGGPWHVFHFIGHGGFDPRSDEGVLLLADEQGRSSLLTATQMGHLLADHRSLRLALLNACEGAQSSERDLFSSTAATLARRGIPAVVAMQYEITDRAAIEYTRAFYEAVSDGMPVDAAVSEARKAITFSIANTLEWATPVLYLRSPDSALFEIAKEKRHKPAATTHKPKAEAAAPAEEQPAPAAPAVPRGTILAAYHGNESGTLALAWSPDDRRVASAGFDDVVQVWNAATGSQVLTYSGHTWRVRAVAWSPDGASIASGGDDRSVQVWNAKDGTLRFKYEKHCNTLAWSPDGSRLAIGGGGSAIDILDGETGDVVFSYTGHDEGEAVTSLAWSPDGSRIASGSTDATVQVWMTTPGGSAFTYRGHRESVWAVAWSSDGKHIASAGDPDGKVYVWDTSTWGNVTTYDGHTERVVALSWSPNNKHIASGGEDNKVHLWDISNNGSRLYTFTEHTQQIAALAWSHDGKRIASASDKAISALVWQAG